MTEEGALRLFVSENFEFLTSGTYDRRSYKERHNRFFYRKHANKYGHPSPSAVATALIDYLSSRGVANQNIGELLEKAKFMVELSDQVRQSLKERLTDNRSASLLAQPDLAAIRTTNTYEAIVKHRTAEITSEVKKELDTLTKEIKAKRTEYEAVQSLLDDASNLSEPEIKPEVEATKPWWQRFYLKSDPFLGKDGLSSISEDLYEQVIIKTAPFHGVVSNLDKNPDYLFGGGFLLAGGYGYGKTTLIDYLSHLLISRNVIPIRIACGRAFLDSAGFADSFYQRLRKELKDEATKVAALGQSSIDNLEVEDQVVELARAIASLKGGLIIFLDDYHKHRSHFPQIFEFLGTLQVLKDDLFRKHAKVGFVVSGLPLWRAELRTNGQLSGFLDRPPIEMPEIAAELVCDVFNKRIAAFCYDKSPRLIKADFVRRLVKEMEGKAGFRDYLGKIVEELSNNNQAIVDSPLEISENVLGEIKSHLENDGVVRTALNKLLNSSRFKKFSEQQIARSLELLVYTAIQNGIAEDDVQFLDNKYYFMSLRDAGLIQKRRVIKAGVCEWGLQTRLTQAFAQITERYRYHPSDYILKIYAYKDYGTRQHDAAIEDASNVTELKRTVTKFASLLDRSAHDSIGAGLKAYDAIILSHGRDRSDTTQCSRALSAVEGLSNALFELDGSERFFRNAGLSSLQARWRFHPFSEEAVQEMFARVDDQQHEPQSSQKLALAIKQASNVAQLIAGHLRSIIDERCSKADVVVLNRPLVHDDAGIDVFRAARDLAYSSRREDHFNYVRRVTDYLELRVRKLLFLLCQAVAGPAYYDMCPGAFRRYAYKNLESRESYAVEVNKFDGLTRSQLKTILVEGNPIKDRVISAMRLLWKRDDWDVFADVFATENIKTAHLQVDAFSPLERKRYLRYCVMVEEFIGAANTIVSRLVRSHVFCKRVEDDGDHLPVIFRIYLRYVVLQDCETGQHVFAEWPKAMSKGQQPADHRVRNADAERIVAMVDAKLNQTTDGLVIEDLLDLEYVSGHYRVGVVDFLCILAYAHHVTRMFVVDGWFGSSVSIRRRSSDS